MTKLVNKHYKYLQIGKPCQFLPTICDCAYFPTTLILPKIKKGNEKINKPVGYHST